MSSEGSLLNHSINVYYLINFSQIKSFVIFIIFILGNRKTWELLDVHTLRNSAFHSQADGITARFNHTIKDMLTQFVVQEKQNLWDLKLEKLSFAYNQTNAIDMGAKNEADWIASEFVDQQRKEMRAIFDFAPANRDAAALKASSPYDRTIRGIDFRSGTEYGCW